MLKWYVTLAILERKLSEIPQLKIIKNSNVKFFKRPNSLCKWNEVIATKKCCVFVVLWYLLLFKNGDYRTLIGYLKFFVVERK